MIDVEDFAKREIETKGIIIIDEIDKLASNVNLHLLQDKRLMG